MYSRDELDNLHNDDAADHWAELEASLSYQGDPAQEELEIEFNGQFDAVSEAYCNQIENELEAYYGYCDGAEEAGETPLGFDAWKAEQAEQAATRRSVPVIPAFFDDMPF